MKLLWTPHHLASLGALRAQIPTQESPGVILLTAAARPLSAHLEFQILQGLNVALPSLSVHGIFAAVL